jgi:two-component system, cell cycle response regulator DivK
MNGSTILLVEDNEDNALICRTWLEHFGLRVVRASDGREGLRLARELAPDLIVLDLSLPYLSGWEVAEALRGDGAEVPIVIWSAHDDRADRFRAESLRCAGYLVKPCSPARVLAEVERVLASAAPAVAARPAEVSRRPARWARGAAASAVLTVGAVLAWRRVGRGRSGQWWSSLARPVLNAGWAAA